MNMVMVMVMVMVLVMVLVMVMVMTMVLGAGGGGAGGRGGSGGGGRGGREHIRDIFGGVSSRKGLRFGVRETILAVIVGIVAIVVVVVVDVDVDVAGVNTFPLRLYVVEGMLLVADGDVRYVNKVLIETDATLRNWGDVVAADYSKILCNSIFFFILHPRLESSLWQNNKKT